MGDIYRVIVQRESGEGRDYTNATLFEVAGSPELIGALLPQALRAALDSATESQAAGAVLDDAIGKLPPAAEAPQQKRKRRTKAEIAADEAAQAAGFRDAAHQREATASGPGADPASAAQQSPPGEQAPAEHQPPAPFNPFAVG